jgi:hypothetical protein
MFLLRILIFEFKKKKFLFRKSSQKILDPNKTDQKNPRVDQLEKNKEVKKPKLFKIKFEFEASLMVLTVDSKVNTRVYRFGIISKKF